MMNLEQSIFQSNFNSEHEKFMINVIYTSNLFSLISTRLFKPYDLSPEQYNVLRILRGQKGQPISIIEIEHRMLDKSSNVSRLVDKLKIKDYLKRATSKKDRRKIEITISESGQQVLQQIDLLLNDLYAHLKNSITLNEAKLANSILDKSRMLDKSIKK